MIISFGRDVTMMKHLQTPLFRLKENKWPKDGPWYDKWFWCPAYFLMETTCDIIRVTRCTLWLGDGRARQRARVQRIRIAVGTREDERCEHGPHSSRAVITLAGCVWRAPQQRCWGWLIIIAIRSHLRYVAYVCPTLYRIRRPGSRTICASTALLSCRFYSVIHPLLQRGKERERGKRKREKCACDCMSRKFSIIKFHD